MFDALSNQRFDIVVAITFGRVNQINAQFPGAFQNAARLQLAENFFAHSPENWCVPKPITETSIRFCPTRDISLAFVLRLGQRRSWDKKWF